MAQFRHHFVLIIFAVALLLYISDSKAGIDTTATWTFRTGASVYSSPTCDSGSVYIGSDDWNLYCLDAASGSMNWKFKTGGLIRCKPAITDTIVYFESDDGNLYAVGKNSGSKIWSLNIGNNIKRILPDPTTSTGNYWDYMQSSPCIDTGVVYVGSGDSSLYAINALTGELKWKTKTHGIIRSSPCVYQSNVYVGSWDGFIYALKKTDGSQVWKYNTNGQYQNVQPSPRVFDGIIYCGSRNPKFYAIDAATGALIWSYSYGGSWVESSATIENGIVYVGSSDLKKVLAFDAKTGKVIWSGNVSGPTWSSPFYYFGTLYIGLAGWGNTQNTQVGGGLLAINATTGKVKWQLACGTSAFIGGVVSSPTIDGHTVYYGSLDGNVYAVDTAFRALVNEIKNTGEIPKVFQLYDNYPNPFNPTTTIGYQVSISSNITLKVYDILGREVKILVDEVKKPGNYEVKLDGSNLSSGVYFNRLTSGSLSKTKAIMLLK